MSDATKKLMLKKYLEEPDATLGFTGMFRARPENFHNSEEVEIDIVRSEEDVSIVVTDLSTGYRMNSEDLYTNKGFKPPIHREAIILSSDSLLKRKAGDSPFADSGFRFEIAERMLSGMRKVERKIKRAMELQASQIMQTGIITLTDETGAALYTLNYAPKATHFPTAGTSWASATLAQKIADIQSLCNVVRADGLSTPDQLYFGEKAWENLIQTPGFLDLRFNAMRASLGTITPKKSIGEGMIYRGSIDVGNYSLDVFTYDGRYKNPQTGVSTEYMHTGKVGVRASSGRLDATFGMVPNIGVEIGASKPLIPEIHRRFSSPENRTDLFTNIWLTPDGEQLMGGVSARPLLIPTAIDTFGCLNTQLS
ncbi:MAG: major capsid protein [Marinagarivorans sp.]|nr:major capsid protein [Marinagarivorans sp.]